MCALMCIKKLKNLPCKKNVKKISNFSKRSKFLPAIHESYHVRLKEISFKDAIIELKSKSLEKKTNFP